MTGASAYISSNNQRQRVCRETSTNLLRHFKDSSLTCEEDGSSEDTLNDLAANAFVKTLDALLLENSEEAIQSGLVLSRAGLQSTLHDTGRI